MKTYAEEIQEQGERDFRGAAAACMQDSAPVPEGVPWPAALAPEAFHGLAGDIVQAILPHSEADPAALLAQLLIGFGSVVGRGPYYRVGADHHRINLFGVLVGPTSKGRKGSAWSAVLQPLEATDEVWADKRITSGLSTGEGVIWACRDPIQEKEALRDRDRKSQATRP